MIGWEERELLNLKWREREAAERADHARLRLRLLMDQSEYRWLELRGKVLAACAGVNKREGSSRFRWDDKPNPLEIFGSNETTLTVEYISMAHVVRFSGESMGADGREYELTVRTVQGNDAVVWIERETGRIRTAKDIADSVVRDLLGSQPGTA